jgi:PAS domain S-box-containing protein
MLVQEKISEEFLIDNFKEALLIIDQDGIVLRANKRVEEVLNYHPGEVVGKNFNFLFLNRHVEFHEMLKFLEVDELTFEETVLVKKHRKHFHARLRIKRHAESGMQVVYITDVDKRVNYRLAVEQKVNAIEKLSRSRYVRNGQFEKAVHEILETASRTMNVQRVNAWMVDEGFTKIHCIGSYNGSTRKFSEEKDLYRADMPAYFNLLQSEEIIICDDTLKDKKVKELVETYLKPLGITSMMDFPVRIEGKVAGLVCFEHVGPKRVWDINEQKFGMVVSQLLSLAQETHERQHANKELQILLREINHRTKNNLSIAVSLLGLQAENAKDEYHKQLFAECGTRLLSIAALHELLYQTDSFTKVELDKYIEKIALYAEQSFNTEKKVSLKIKCEPLTVGITAAVTLGLITNELITNCYKYAFAGRKKGVIEVQLTRDGKKNFLIIHDNGKGIEKDEVKKGTLGMTLVKGLADQMGAKISWSGEEGTTVKVQFNLA